MLLSILSALQANNSTIFWIMIAVWSAVVIGTLVVELSTADITSIWFFVASLVSLVLAVFNINFIIQIVVFFVLSVVLVIATKPLTKNLMNKTLIRTNADRILESVGIVTKRITSYEVGEVVVENVIWRAMTFEDEEIEEGEKVIVHSFNGNKVVVSKIEKNNNVNFV